jgi:FtsH-binding integral membrane protein
MTRLVKAFLDIALWRKSPAVLPASTFLLALVAIVAALVEALGDALQPHSRHDLLLRMAFSVTVPLCFTWVVLALTKRRDRFLQTGSAVLGVALLAGCVSYMVAGANIWRAALDSGVMVGGMVSLAYFLLQILLGQLLAAPA